MTKTLTVTLELIDDDRFTVTILDDESGLSNTYDHNTPNIDITIGVDIMSWVDMMDMEDE